ncbi:MAG: LysR family transcriptional regulator [Acidobacteriota bacterium]|nr:LysR family transcriptional regulator [Acidobacteriota bacterium]
MELFQLETFLSVAREKSFSRAAARLHRTQSAVSQTIAKLEDSLGEKLFDRSSRAGSLTDAGRTLVAYADELLNVREEARDALKELRRLHQGKLSIAANEFTSRYLLPVLHRFHHTHPMIRIEVKRGLAREIPSSVLNHDVEFGVVSFRPEGEHLTSLVLYRDELALIVYPGHPLAQAKRVGIKDLGAESFIAHSVLSPYRERVIQAFKKHRTLLHMNIELPTIEDIKHFVRMENGVALVPLIAVEQEIRRGDVVHVPVGELAFERKLRVVHRKGSVLSHAGQAFLSTCRAMAEAPGARYMLQPEH